MNKSSPSSRRPNPTVWVIKMDAAGEIQWQKVMRDTIFYSHLILGSNIEQTQDGGYVFAMSFLWPPGTFVCQVVKLYSNGSIQWIKSYPAGRTGLVIHQTPDGGYLVGGDGFNNYLLFKIDKLGKQLWARTYGGSSLENFGDMCLTLDNGCIITGSSWSDNGDVTGHHGPGGNNAYPDYWVVKLDSAGTLEWERSLGGIYVEQSYDILQTSKEEYLVCGITTSNDGDVSGHHGVTGDAPDAWLVKLDQQGAIIWQKCLGGTLYVDDIHSILEVPDGGYILAGGTASNDGNVSGTPHGDTDAWILKLNTDGHIERMG